MDKSQQPIIIKKKKAAHGHHGGAWKIAYADFVTAMMAFFLLMWLLGSTTKGDLMGISDYFQTPLQVALFGGSGAGDATSIINGGGTDLTRKSGQVKKNDIENQRKNINMRVNQTNLDYPSRATINKTDKSSTELPIGDLGKIKEAMDSLLETSLANFKNQLLIDLVDDGLRIQIIDDKNRPMFDIGSSQMQSYTKDILIKFSETLTNIPNFITISGHTDAYVYKTKDYTNWELSSDRANSARRVMQNAGIDSKRFLRIIGHGDAILFNTDNPFDPTNRRISIVILNEKAQQRFIQESKKTLSITNKDEIPNNSN